MQDYSRLMWWSAAAGWAAAILLSSSDAFSSAGTGGVLARLLGGVLSEEALAAVNFMIRKGAHVVAYAILGALADRAEGSAKVALVVALIVAVTDEWHQSTTALRTGSPGDVLLDLAGAAIGVGVRRQSRRFRT